MVMKRKISFCYRKIIDKNASKAWERLVWEDSYAEFKMQAQRFNNNGGLSSFGEMLTASPAAQQLHFLVSHTATAYVQQLNGIVPDVLNTIGKRFLPFSNFKFEIINSDLKDATKHQVAVNFFTEPLIWMDTIGNMLLLHLNKTTDTGALLTETFVPPAFVSIWAVQEEE
jgi:hypothetical protein